MSIVEEGGIKMKLDKQEELIVKALIKDSRMSDNQIGKLTKVPIKTVNRKRKKLEEDEKISYFTAFNIKKNENPKAQHLYIIKFNLGQTKKKLMDEIKKESKIKTLFTELIFESQFSEVEGHTAIIMIVEGKTDDEISENFNGKILPLMLKNHGQDSIMNISTIRLSDPIRIFHNYLPWMNMKNGKLKKDISLENIYVEKE